MSAPVPVRITGQVTLSDGTTDNFMIDSTDWEVDRDGLLMEEASASLIETLAGVIHSRALLTAVEPEVTCRWCGEEIGIIHYGDEDRWQVTPQLYETCPDGPVGLHEPWSA